MQKNEVNQKISGLDQTKVSLKGSLKRLPMTLRIYPCLDQLCLNPAASVGSELFF